MTDDTKTLLGMVSEGWVFSDAVDYRAGRRDAQAHIEEGRFAGRGQWPPYSAAQLAALGPYFTQGYNEVVAEQLLPQR